MVEIYIRTRGLRIDYCFLPEQPEIKNLNNYQTDFEKPTCILERTEEKGCYLFLSGIPSKRKDHQGTPLRYDLVVKSGNWVDDGDHNTNTENIDGLIDLIWMWLDDVRKALQETQEDGKPSKRVRLPVAIKSELGKRLDVSFPEEAVEKLLKLTVEQNWTELDKINLNSQLNNFLLQIPPRPNLPVIKWDDFNWWGGVDKDDSYNQWIKLVEKLLKAKTQGKALLLNIATPKSLGRLLVENQELGVLLAKEYYASKPRKIEPIDLSKTDQKLISENVKKTVKPILKWWMNSQNRVKNDPSNPWNWNSDIINEHNDDQSNEKKKVCSDWD
ncbi:MAG: hypothetical protein VKK42_01125 [Lyngbya sp.]|nr:hypothetical protein [Lyngbya sp.]